tara:strand:- start:5822 stop:5983 length:162 start_codon:yes stop_codon:yes gene_type:complete
MDYLYARVEPVTQIGPEVSRDRTRYLGAPFKQCYPPTQQGRVMISSIRRIHQF